jgi:hypothetical protein
MNPKLIFDPAKFLALIAEISKTKVPEYSKQKDIQDIIRINAVGVLYELADFSPVVIIYDEREAIQLHFGKAVGMARIQIFIKKDGKADVMCFLADGRSKTYEAVPVEAVGALVLPELEELYKEELEQQ